jgi:hypothetical protein
MNKKAIAAVVLMLALVFFAGLLVGDAKSTLSFNQMLEEENLYLVDREVVNSCVANLNNYNMGANIWNGSFEVSEPNTTTRTIK